MGSGGGTSPREARRDHRTDAPDPHSSTRSSGLSGGVFSDYYIHQIDECSWMKGAWPVEAMAIGGRHYRGNSLDQNFDVYSVQYTYPDGTRLFFDGRNMPGVPQRVRQLRSRVEGLGRGLDHLRTRRAARGSTRARTSRAGNPGRPSPRTRIWCGRFRSPSARPTIGSGTT